MAPPQVQSAAAQQAAQSSVQASRWGALTRVVRYQAAVKSLQAELTSRHAEWERERAGLQGAAETAVRRAETLLAELTDLRQQVLRATAVLGVMGLRLCAIWYSEVGATQQTRSNGWLSDAGLCARLAVRRCRSSSRPRMRTVRS